VKLGRDNARAAYYYVKAVKLAPKESELFIEADRFLALNGFSSERDAVAKLSQNGPMAHPKFMERKARYFTDKKQFEKAIALLRSRNFKMWESEYSSREIYEDAFNGYAEEMIRKGDLSKAADQLRQAEEFPWNIVTQKVPERVTARSRYLLGVIQLNLGNRVEALRLWESVRRPFGLSRNFMTFVNIRHYYQEERWFFSSLVNAECGKIGEARKQTADMILESKKSEIHFNRYVTCLVNWGFIENGKNAHPAKKMACGRKIPAVIRQFAAKICGIVNEKRQ